MNDGHDVSARRDTPRRELSDKVLHPPHPERVCWGCDLYCPADSLRCGNGSERTQHPSELFGNDWDGWPVEPTAK